MGEHHLFEIFATAAPCITTHYVVCAVRWGAQYTGEVFGTLEGNPKYIWGMLNTLGSYRDCS